jgi:kinesin family protein 2/24
MLLRSLNFNGESLPASVSEPFTPTAQNFGSGNSADGLYSPELRGDLGAGLLDLHAMDDTGLLSDVRLQTISATCPHVFLLTFMS